MSSIQGQGQGQGQGFCNPGWMEKAGGDAPPPYNDAMKPTAPPPAFQPQQQSQPQPPRTTVVVVQQPTSPNVHCPTVVDCPYCRAHVSTAVSFRSGGFTHLFAIVLCALGCWPCCLCPYCIDGCQDTVHDCPNCGKTLGVVSRL